MILVRDIFLVKRSLTMFSNPSTGQVISSSTAALSLASTEAGLVVLAVATGAAITIAGVTYVYDAIQEYKAKEIQKEAEYINILHARFLEKIPIYDLHEIQGFPPPFKITKEGDSVKIDSMHFTEEQIRKFGTNLPRSEDIELVVYQKYIENAIKKLKTYYDSRDDKHDITSSVLVYLMYFLEKYCYSFSGYDYDTAYLDGIEKFINELGSEKNNVNSKRFSYLSKVYPYILDAKQELEKRKQAMSLTTMLNELNHACIKINEDLIKCMTMVSLDSKHWPLIENAPMDKLAQGVVNDEYVSHQLFGFVLWTTKEVDTLLSLFGKWAIVLANYYWKALDPLTTLTENDIKSPDQEFVYPDLKILNNLRQKKNLSSEEKLEKKRLENEMEALKKSFASNPNFFTTIVDPATITKKTPKFLIIKDEETIINRTEAVAKLATLTHKISETMDFASEFIKCSKQLGEIKLKSPNHFVGIFNLLYDLCHQIGNDVKDCKMELQKIQKTNKNSMRLGNLRVLPDLIFSTLDICEAKITTSCNRIHEYREKVRLNLNVDEPTYESVVHEIFTQATFISKLYKLKYTENVADLIESHISNPKNTVKNIELKLDKETETVKDVQENKDLKAIVIHEERKHHKSNKKLLKKDKVKKDKKNRQNLHENNKEILSAVANSFDPSYLLPKIFHNLKSENILGVQDVSPSEELKVNDEMHLHSDQINLTNNGIANNGVNSNIAIAADDAIQQAPNLSLSGKVNGRDEKIHQSGIIKYISPPTDAEMAETLTSIKNSILRVKNDSAPSEYNINAKNHFEQEMQAYLDLHAYIVSVYQKYISIKNGNDKSLEMRNKTEHMLNLVENIVNYFAVFMKMERAERIKSVSQFNQLIQIELTNKRHACLDGHTNNFWKSTNSLFGSDYFSTDSRSKLKNVGLACERLTQILLEEGKELTSTIVKD